MQTHYVYVPSRTRTHRRTEGVIARTRWMPISCDFHWSRVFCVSCTSLKWF